MVKTGSYWFWPLYNTCTCTCTCTCSYLPLKFSYSCSRVKMWITKLFSVTDLKVGGLKCDLIWFVLIISQWNTLYNTAGSNALVISETLKRTMYKASEEVVKSVNRYQEWNGNLCFCYHTVNYYSLVSYGKMLCKINNLPNKIQDLWFKITMW